MPIYGIVITPAELEATLPNNINEDTLNPFVSPVLDEDSVWIEQEKPLDVPTTLPVGQDHYRPRLYYRNLYAAPTTAGYTNMTQVTFTRHTGMITGYQIGVPLR